MGIFSPKRIYADWAATTPLHSVVRRAMRRAERFTANPSAIHTEGVRAKKALEETRLMAARAIGIKPAEVYFTSGGTESNATIIQGVIRTFLEKGIAPHAIHVISSTIEHSSILETLSVFEKHGVRVSYVTPNTEGIVNPEQVLSLITPETVLVTCMYANNEIGTIQPISKIGAGIRKIKGETLREYPVFHSDASQAPLWLSCDMEGLRVDAMTLDGHKMQGPKGVGALMVRSHVAFLPLMVGGGQEKGKRPTTESISLVIGFAEALRKAQSERESNTKQARLIQEYFFSQIKQYLPEAVVNGSVEKRLPNNVNMSLPHVSDPEFAVLFLDKHGVACSTKSSCLKGEEFSYVVKALGGDVWRAQNTLRFTFSPRSTKRQIDRIIKLLVKLPKF